MCSTEINMYSTYRKSNILSEVATEFSRAAERELSSACLSGGKLLDKESDRHVSR